MCDFFWQRMDSSTTDGGDLSDIVRSVTASGTGPTSSSDLPELATDPTMPFNPLSADDFVTGGDGFGIRDPLLHELTGSDFYGSSRSGNTGGGGGGGDQLPAQKLLVADHEINKRPNCVNLFSRVLQISPAKPSPLSPREIKPFPMATVDHAVQISSPRNAPGIKRRKSQAKKVVCIPAPAAASSRPSGEVVPSDLWAWRKYGQKPIKGSPYPRGYYRCSSSKECSARKQVERSRTDPNMLVITYTSEHNHPWPTQRNALAGSTRSQPLKIGSSTSSKHLKEEPKDTNNITAATSSSSLPVVKEEEAVLLGDHQILDKAPMANDHSFDQVVFYNEPITDDLFADLAELESDPMSLIFSSRSDEEGIKERNKGVDSCINMFDWGDSSFGDQSTNNKGL